MQVSRWDELKDPLGVIRGFAEHVPEAHLVYAGPAVAAVTDDPEGEQVLRNAQRLRDELPEQARRRLHLACLPMDDPEENAIIVNALQRHARVVVQKSLAEGFGLTVAEAMWKARPVVASRIGGIQDQIEDGTSGVLLDDPHDLAAFGDAVARLLADPDRAERMGDAARERVRNGFLSSRSLLDYLGVVRGGAGLTGGACGARAPYAQRMAFQPDDLLSEAALQAAVAALAERNQHHLADMNEAEQSDAVGHWRELAMTVLTAARTATGPGPAEGETGGRAAIVLEDAGGDEITVHASFYPQLEDLGGGEVAATPAQATALELLEQLAGDEEDEPEA